MRLNNIHPVLKFLTIIIMAILCQGVALSWMMFFMFLVAILLNKPGCAHWYRIITKMRWLFVIMLLIYAYNTPGEYLGAGFLMPTYEGLRVGIRQWLYISLISGLILWVQRTTSQENQVYAVYQLLIPFGLSKRFREKVAVRWALTLRYAEQFLENNDKIQFKLHKFTEIIDQLMGSMESNPSDSLNIIQITRPPWHFADFIYLLCLLVGSIYALSAWN